MIASYSAAARDAEADELEAKLRAAEVGEIHGTVGCRSIPGAATDATKWSIGLISRPLGDISAHVMKAKLVGLLQSHGPCATTVRHVLLGSCRVVPVPRDLVQIIAAAVGESLARRTAARRPFPLRAAGEPVAIGFWIDAGNDISCFENFALGEVDRLETFHFALGVAPFQSIEPADALHGVVWQGVCGGFFEVVSLGLRKGAHGLPFAPYGFRFA